LPILRVVGVVRRLYSNLTHPLQDVFDLFVGAFCGVNQSLTVH